MDNVEIKLQASDPETTDLLDYQLLARANSNADDQYQSSATGRMPAKRPAEKGAPRKRAEIDQSNG